MNKFLYILGLSCAILYTSMAYTDGRYLKAIFFFFLVVAICAIEGGNEND